MKKINIIKCFTFQFTVEPRLSITLLSDCYDVMQIRLCIFFVTRTFKTSSGWIEKFENHHGIRQLNIEGEKLSAASMETVNAYKEEVLKRFKEPEHQNFLYFMLWLQIQKKIGRIICKVLLASVQFIQSVNLVEWFWLNFKKGIVFF